jgi:hypothetical protein
MCVRKPIGIMNEIKKIFNYTKILYNHDSFRYMHHVSGENIAQFLLPKICPIIGSLVPAVD